MDYRKDAYPLLRIDNTLDALRGSQYFSTLDLYLGYWQVKMDPRDINKPAFVTRQGLFHFTVMPFGLLNAPATAHGACVFCAQLVIVYGGNFYDALDMLKTVWQRIREASLKLKPSHCCLMHNQVPFLGHYILRDGVEIDTMKTVAVQDWPTPHTVKDVRVFLGLA